MTITEKYHALYSDHLQNIANALKDYLCSTLGEVKRIDRISARAKTPRRFIEKAEKTDDNGEPKYSDPINEIQDQIGARITVFYVSDVARIKEEIEKYFTYIERQGKSPEKDSEFGYFGEHYVLSLPDDILPDDCREIGCPEFFELQIKTLFQHAWSEAHHDLGYKSIRQITSLERRKIAFSAAQAWGADQIFEELAESLVPQADNEP